MDRFPFTSLDSAQAARVSRATTNSRKPRDLHFRGMIFVTKLQNWSPSVTSHYICHWLQLTRLRHLIGDNREISLILRHMFRYRSEVFSINVDREVDGISRIRWIFADDPARILPHVPRNFGHNSEQRGKNASTNAVSNNVASFKFFIALADTFVRVNTKKNSEENSTAFFLYKFYSYRTRVYFALWK